MKKAELSPGMVVAIKTYGGYCRRAIVVAPDGYVDVGYSWKSMIRPASPGRRTSKVAVAAESPYRQPEGNAWIPELVLPQQIASTWEEYERRQEEIRLAIEERGRRELAAMQTREAQREELKGLIERLGYSGSIRESSYYYGKLEIPYAVAIEIFSELVRALERIDASAN